MAPRDVRSGDHLPKRRRDGQPPDPTWLPRQRRGITPQMIGRYPDYDVFSAESSWDEVTSRVVKARLAPHGGLSFFSPREESTLRAFCDTTTAQDQDPRVPVPEMVDAKLAAGKLDGFRYEDMPDDRQTWRLVLRGLDETAQARGVDAFADLDLTGREAIVDALSKGELDGGAWDELNVKRAWSVCMRAILAAFYSHPWAWNEIGFGGPAYPRGFMRLGQGVSSLEPFEREGATDEDPVRELGERRQ